MSNFVLGENRHGKGRVRLLKLHRNGDRHDFIQLTAQILLSGNPGVMDTAFTAADNRKIIATDTCKNTVYILARRHQFASIEEFAQIIARHFLTTYPTIVHKVDVQLVRDLWSRVVNKDSKGRTVAHNHAFVKVGPQTTFTHIVGRSSGGSHSFELTSGIRTLQVVKTTQSGFSNFHTDEYRSLPDTDDRLVGTSVDAEWKWSPAALSGRTDFEAANKDIIDTLIDEFAGPADKGVFSAAVQHTLYDMGVGVLAKAPLVEKINLYMPNIHNIPVDLSKFRIENRDHTGKPDIFLPIDEPHGMIEASVERPRGSRL